MADVTIPLGDRREVADAWRKLWAADEVQGPPDICEGCSEPATTSDSEGVPLCDACSLESEREWARKAAGLLRRVVAVPFGVSPRDGDSDAADALLAEIRTFLGDE